ncbi:MAG: HEAT repeat domain-containing protein [Armatimonadota bacterium]
MEPWKEEINRIRSGVEEFMQISYFSEAGWDPANDAEFWNTLDSMEKVGEERNASQAVWLASFTQIDDLGPMGRAMFLATVAVSILASMPDAALSAAKHLLYLLPPDASKYRKVGVIKVLHANGSPEAIPLILRFISDRDTYVVREAELALKDISDTITRE